MLTAIFFSIISMQDFVQAQRFVLAEDQEFQLPNGLVIRLLDDDSGGAEEIDAQGFGTIYLMPGQYDNFNGVILRCLETDQDGNTVVLEHSLPGPGLNIPPRSPPPVPPVMQETPPPPDSPPPDDQGPPSWSVDYDGPGARVAVRGGPVRAVDAQYDPAMIVLEDDILMNDSRLSIVGQTNPALRRIDRVDLPGPCAAQLTFEFSSPQQQLVTLATAPSTVGKRFGTMIRNATPSERIRVRLIADTTAGLRESEPVVLAPGESARLTVGDHNACHEVGYDVEVDGGGSSGARSIRVDFLPWYAVPDELIQAESDLMNGRESPSRLSHYESAAKRIPNHLWHRWNVVLGLYAVRLSQSAGNSSTRDSLENDARRHFSQVIGTAQEWESRVMPAVWTPRARALFDEATRLQRATPPPLDPGVP